MSSRSIFARVTFCALLVAGSSTACAGASDGDEADGGAGETTSDIGIDEEATPGSDASTRDTPDAASYVEDVPSEPNDLEGASDGEVRTIDLDDDTDASDAPTDLTVRGGDDADTRAEDADGANPDVPICGDGVLDDGEECDDGEANDDGAPNACRTDCRAARCGDEVIDEGEACDDGNDIDTDECSNGCREVTAALCRPCTSDDECGREIDLCLTLPGGGACAIDCALIDVCPDRFTCTDIVEGDVLVARQCTPELGVCVDCLDDDDDGYGIGPACLGSDCDDDDPRRNPGMAELCDGLDNDCDDTSPDGADEDHFGHPCDSPLDDDLCNDGSFVCDGENLFCDDDDNSRIELCNGEDDDCDPDTPDGVDEERVGTPCDGLDDSDLCTDGFVVCEGGSLRCDDDDRSRRELCNGEDDDCDPGTPDGADEFAFGEPCDNLDDSDLCADGIFICDGARMLCTDDIFGIPDLCNGVDDDCNIDTPDGVDEETLGDVCDGPDEGLCPEGFVVCGAAGLLCTDRSGDDFEVCGGDDEDCDGEVDEDFVCVEPGEACVAVFDLRNGGSFSGNLARATADESSCEPPGLSDHVFSLTVPEGGAIVTLVLPYGPAVGVGIWETCGGAALDCSVSGTGSRWSRMMPAGEMFFHIFGEGAYRFGVGIGRPGACLTPDGDGDLYTICDGDCDDGDRDRNPGRPELCNGRDDDCSLVVDDPSGPCLTGLPGACSFGVEACSRGELVCLPHARSRTEVCDGLDNDCDGVVDNDTCEDGLYPPPNDYNPWVVFLDNLTLFDVPHIAPADGSATTAPLEGAGLWNHLSPTFSPDGNTVAYSRAGGDGLAIRFLDVTTGAYTDWRVSLDATSVRDLSYSRDGTMLAFVATSTLDGSNNIFILNTLSEVVTQLTHTSSPEYNSAPVFDRAGSTIYYVSGPSSETGDVYSMPTDLGAGLDNSRRTRRTNLTLVYGAIDLNFAGTTLLFSTRDAPPALLDLSTGIVTPSALTIDDSSCNFFSAGGRVACARGSVDTEIVILDLADGALLQSLGSGAAPQVARVDSASVPLGL